MGTPLTLTVDSEDLLVVLAAAETGARLAVEAEVTMADQGLPTSFARYREAISRFAVEAVRAREAALSEPEVRPGAQVAAARMPDPVAPSVAPPTVDPPASMQR